MNTIFVEVVAEDGTKSYQPLQDEKALFETVIREHPKYKEVLSESIERRQELQRLKQATETPQTPPTQTVQETPAQPAAPQFDIEAIRAEAAKEAAKLVREQMLAEQQAEKERRQKIDKLLRENGLTDDDRAYVEAAPDPEAFARHLGQRVKTFDAPNEDFSPRTEHGSRA